MRQLTRRNRRARSGLAIAPPGQRTAFSPGPMAQLAQGDPAGR